MPDENDRTESSESSESSAPITLETSVGLSSDPGPIEVDLLLKGADQDDASGAEKYFRMYEEISDDPD